MSVRMTAIFLIAPLVFQELFVNSRLSSTWPAALALLAASLGAPQLSAQVSMTAASPGSPALAAEAADAAPPAYRSALEGYQPYTDEKIVNWKEANDATARIGGWREYAKEASQSQVPEGSAKAEAGAATAKP
ncbi:MAG: hypothetical protein ACWA6Y_00460 [Polaromonas sp.]